MKMNIKINMYNLVLIKIYQSFMLIKMNIIFIQDLIESMVIYKFNFK